MAEPDWTLIVARLDSIQAELREMRTEMQEMRTDMAVLTNLVLHVLRDMEAVKRMLGQMDARISRLEKERS